MPWCLTGDPLPHPCQLGSDVFPVSSPYDLVIQYFDELNITGTYEPSSDAVMDNAYCDLVQQHNSY
jgi:hypothetical protein